MLQDWKKLNPSGNLVVRYIEDNPYNDTLWASKVNSIVSDHAEVFGFEKSNIYLTGTERDATGFYLKMFPQWKQDLFTDTSISHSLSATKVRELYFGSTLSGNFVSGSDREMLLSTLMPITTVHFLTKFQTTEYFGYLLAEYNQIVQYKNSWKSAPYAPMFLTTDAVVVQAGHILLITRKHSPGKGLLALPGGFLNQAEWMVDGAIRELQEETKIKLSPAQLRGSIKAEKIFDKPDRSLRGRTVTMAYLFQLNEVGELPKVSAADDAAAVQWYTLSDVRNMKNQLFDDHYHIIETMIAQMKSL